jgi:hypothetical protein
MPTPQHSETCKHNGPASPAGTAGNSTKGQRSPSQAYVSFWLNPVLSKELRLASKTLRAPASRVVKRMVEASLREWMRIRLKGGEL